MTHRRSEWPTPRKARGWRLRMTLGSVLLCCVIALLAACEGSPKPLPTLDLPPTPTAAPTPTLTPAPTSPPTPTAAPTPTLTPAPTSPPTATAAPTPTLPPPTSPPTATVAPTPTSLPTATAAPTPAPTPPPPRPANLDKAALVALYDATGGHSWRIATNWLSDRPLGEWHGVTTDDNDRVTKVDLRGNELTGPIPPELGNLSNLQSLQLGGNHLTGPIPRELGNLSNLRELGLWRYTVIGSGDWPRLDGAYPRPAR